MTRALALAALAAAFCLPSTASACGMRYDADFDLSELMDSVEVDLFAQVEAPTPKAANLQELASVFMQLAPTIDAPAPEIVSEPVMVELAPAS